MISIRTLDASYEFEVYIRFNIDFREECSLPLKISLETKTNSQRNNTRQAIDKFKDTFDLLAISWENRIPIVRRVAHCLFVIDKNYHPSSDFSETQSLLHTDINLEAYKIIGNKKRKIVKALGKDLRFV
jgi:hypothetical protein